MQKWLNLKTMLGFCKKLMTAIVSFCERETMIKLRFFFEEVDHLLFIIYKNVIVTLNQERQLLIMIMIIIIMLIIMIIILTNDNERRRGHGESGLALELSTIT